MNDYLQGMELKDTAEYKLNVQMLKEAERHLKAAKRAVKKQQDIIKHHKAKIALLEELYEDR